MDDEEEEEKRRGGGGEKYCCSYVCSEWEREEVLGCYLEVARRAIWQKMVVVRQREKMNVAAPAM